MFRVIPTWSVVYMPREGEQQKLRVPEPNLEAVIHVLLFNHVHELHIEVERRGPWVDAIEEVDTEREASR